MTFRDSSRRIFRATDSGDDYFDAWFSENFNYEGVKTALLEVWTAGRTAERNACLKIAKDAMIADPNVLEGSEVAKSQHETAMLIARDIEARGQ